MKNGVTRKYILILFSMLVLMILTISDCMGESSLSAGFIKEQPPAPEFTLSDISGNTVRLSDFKGKLVIVNFFDLDCTPSRQVLFELSEIQRKYSSRGLVVLGICVEPYKVSEIQYYFKNSRNRLHILYSSEKVEYDYGEIDTVPTTVIISPEGKVIWYGVGLIIEQDLAILLEPLFPIQPKGGSKSKVNETVTGQAPMGTDTGKTETSPPVRKRLNLVD